MSDRVPQIGQQPGSVSLMRTSHNSQRIEEYVQYAEYRIDRFAELDAQIQAEDDQRRAAAATPKRRRRQEPNVPAAMCKEITQSCGLLRRKHRALFMADPKLKDRAARLFRNLLLPKP